MIDDDFKHDGSEVTAAVLHKTGLHPIRLFYKYSPGPFRLDRKWSGPGAEKRPMNPSNFAAGMAGGW